MGNIRRYGPLLGVLIIALATVARAFGREDLARSVDIVGTITGFGAESPVTATELTAAAAAVTGIVLKVSAVVRERDRVRER